MSVLALDAVRRTFADGTDAVAGVTLEVAAGEIVALVGPSGCGKSTLLRLAAALDRPTAGTVTAPPPDDIAFVFQDPTLLPWRSVRANVELLGELRGVPRAERRRAAQEAIELVGLAGFERHLPNRLSGGMRMRASLARALTLRPRLFLLDEPFSAVDELTRERLNAEVQQILLDAGCAAVLVTHSITEAVFMASRVVVLSPRPARIVADVPVDLDLPRDPDVRFSAELAEVAATVSRAVQGMVHA